MGAGAVWNSNARVKIVYKVEWKREPSLIQDECKGKRRGGMIEKTSS